MKPEKIYYFNGTHWDREWYKTFQGFRYLLMGVLDEVIETLEQNDDFPVYMLDGQTAVLDDYLEISPEQRERLIKLIRDGRIAVGPWYTQPDEFIPSGESLIRNLLLGHAKAKEYGAKAAMRYGYICDIFGHIAQMPQIFAGFGIEGALMQRGNNMDTTPPHFRWESPDGTVCMAYRTPEDFGYGAFYHYATEPYNQGWDTSLEHLFERAVKEIDRELEDLNLPYLVLHDALDHQHITKAAPWLAKKLAEHYGCEVVFKTLDELVEDVRALSETIPVRKGELAETAHMDLGTNILLSYVVSSRYDIKKLNDQAQNIWEKWAEPLSAIHAITGRAIRPGYRDVAYKELIRNHAHDSICGCAVEEVHRDMKYRFRQTEMIGKEVIEDCLRQDVAEVNCGEEPKQMMFRVFSPLPYEGRRTVKLDICFPEDFSRKFSEGERPYEYKNSFFIYDAKGNEVPYTLCGIRRHSIVKSPTYYIGDVYTVCISADFIPMGYTEFKVVPAEIGVRTRYIMGQRTDSLTAENKTLKLTVQPDGRVTITDKRTGRAFTDLLGYRDGAEIGDGWMHIKPSSDNVFYGPCNVESLECVYDGPAETCFRITQRMRLPERMHEEGGRLFRSEEKKTLVIATTLRLGAENDYVDVQTDINNNILDHRLQVCFPTDVTGDTYQAGQAFTVVTRPVGADAGTTHWKEPQYGDRNCSGIAIRRDENGGLAFLSKEGIHEVNAMADTRATLAMTLYRCFAKTVGTDDYSQMDGQLQRPLQFNYRLMPLTPETSEGHIIRTRDELQTGTENYTMYVNDSYELGKDVPFVKVCGEDLAVSILKRPEDLEENTFVIRLYNCSDAASSGMLTTALPIEAAWNTDLLEQPKSAAVFDAHQLPLQLGARKIATYRITLKK